MEPTSKTPIIVGILLVIAAVVYYFYTGQNSMPAVNPDSSLTLTAASSSDSGVAVGSEVLSLLAEVRSSEIDMKFFSNPVYESLTDFSVVIPPEPIGKANPFTPIPGYSSTASAASAVPGK